MKRNLSVFFLSRPIIAANARGEGHLNTACLQKISSSQDSLTVMNGVAIRHGVRDFMQADGTEVFRHHEDGEGSRSGYTFGPNHSPSKEDYKIESQGDFPDLAMFGDMLAAKGSEAEAKVFRSVVLMSPAVSTTAYTDDVGYMRGLKADGQTNPTTFERHFTRYQFAFTIDLARTRKIGGCASEGVRLVLESLLGLQIGGSQSSNASELLPAIIAWQFHNRPGLGGMYIPDLKVDVEATPTLEALEAQSEDLGFTFDRAGQGCDLTCRKGIDAIWEAAQKELTS
jgi:hypothetical protein